MDEASEGSKFVAKNASIPNIMRSLRSWDIPGIVLDQQIMILYDLDRPWFNDNLLVLSELMVLRFAPGTSGFKDIDAALCFLAQAAGATHIAVGGALSERPRVLARAYKSVGYVEEDSPVLIKEI